MSAEDEQEYHGLCYRCEHRARFLEKGWRPRYECGDVTSAKYACYMFKPVQPVMLGKLNPDDPRPALGPAMIASRVQHLGLAPGAYRLKIKDGKMIPYFVPEGEEPKPEGD